MSIALLTSNQAHKLDGKLKKYWKNYYKKATLNLYQDFQLKL